MKRFALILGLAAATMANAQLNDVYPSNASIRAGWAYPLDDGVRDIWKQLIGVGIDYTFQTQFIRGSETFLSIDWLGGSGSGAKGNAFPIILNQRFRGTDADGNPSRTYTFLGVGLAIVDFTSSKTTLGARAGIGTALGENIFAEGILFWSDAAAGARANAIGVYLGYRF